MDAQTIASPVSDFLLLFAHLSLNGRSQSRVAFASNATESVQSPETVAFPKAATLAFWGSGAEASLARAGR